MCTCYNMLTIKLIQSDDMHDIEYLARFKYPLKAVCKEWIKHGGSHSGAFDTMLHNLAESGSTEIYNDFDSD